MKSGALVVDRVSRRFKLSSRPHRTLKDLVVKGRGDVTELWALRDVSFQAEPGDALALVGRNGSGKTTLLRIVSGIIKPTSGTAAAEGRIASLLELGAGFHPDFTGRENVYLNGAIHGLSRAEITEQFDEIVAFAELERFIDAPVRTYSSGMYMRLGFSIAAHVHADILLLDEVFAVGDEEFQRKCFGKISEHKQRGGTIIFVSHDAHAVAQLCERAVLLVDGAVAVDGTTSDAIAEYRRVLADERNPEEVGAGLREWGAGAAKIVSVKLIDSDGDERVQATAGEPLTVVLEIESAGGVEAPVVAIEVADNGGLVLGATSQPTNDLGWGIGGGTCQVRFELASLPLADGRFKLRCSLVTADGETLLHGLDEAVSFLVFPAGAASGSVLLDGHWSLQPGSLQESGVQAAKEGV